jgi:hypothetical protein
LSAWRKQEFLAVVELVRFTGVGRGYKNVIPQREIIVEIEGAVVIVGDTCHDELFRLDPLADEEIAIPLRGDTEVAILVR